MAKQVIIKAVIIRLLPVDELIFTENQLQTPQSELLNQFIALTIVVHFPS